MVWFKAGLLILSCLVRNGLSIQWVSSRGPMGADLFAIAFEICSSVNNVTNVEADDTLDMHAPHPCLRKCHLEMLNMLNPNDPEFNYKCTYSLEEIMPELHYVVKMKQRDLFKTNDGASFSSAAREYTEINSKNYNKADNLKDPDTAITHFDSNTNKSLETTNRILNISCSCDKIIENLEENPKDYMINAQCKCNLPIRNNVFSITNKVNIKTEIEIDFDEY